MVPFVKHVAVYVRDPERALEFYTRRVGFELGADHASPIGRWIELVSPGHETRLVLFTPRPGQEDAVGGLSNVMLAVANVEETYRELVARGVEFAEAPRRQDWGVNAMFRDPDGNLFTLTEP